MGKDGEEWEEGTDGEEFLSIHLLSFDPPPIPEKTVHAAQSSEQLELMEWNMSATRQI